MVDHQTFKDCHSVKTQLIWLKFCEQLSYVHTGTILYRYRTGLIFGTENLTVDTGPVRYRTSFGDLFARVRYHTVP